MYLVMHYAEALYYHNTYQINQVYYQTTVKHARTRTDRGHIQRTCHPWVVSTHRLVVLPTTPRHVLGTGVIERFQTPTHRQHTAH